MMKKTILSTFVLLILCTLVVSCGNSGNSPLDEPENGASHSIEIIGGEEASSLAFGEDGGVKVIAFRSTDSWTIKVPDGSDPWIKVSPSSGGAGESSIKVEAMQNVETENRQCQFAIVTAHKKVTIEVAQMQKDAMVVANDSYSIPEEGGDIEIEIGHNVDFDVKITGDWISRKESRAFQTESLGFQISKNPDVSRRVGCITFVSKDNKLSQKVRIIQDSKESKNLQKNFLPMDWKENKLVKCDPEKGVFSYVPSSSQEPLIEKGSTFIVDVDTAAYLVIAKEISKEGDVTTVKTMEGTMADLFHDVQFSLSTEKKASRSKGNVFYPTEIIYQQKDGKLITEKYQESRAVTHDTRLTSDLWKYHFDAGSWTIFKNDYIDLGISSLDLDLALDMNLNFNFGGVSKLEMVQEGIERYVSEALQVSADVTGDMSFEHLFSFKIGGHYSDSFTFPILQNVLKTVKLRFVVYGVPVVIDLAPELYAEGSYDIDSAITSTTGFKLEADGKLGIEWDQSKGNPQPIKTLNYHFGFEYPHVEGKGMLNAKVALCPKIAFMLYGKIGPEIEVKPYLETELEGGFNKDLIGNENDMCAWTFDLFAGADFDMGINFHFLNIEEEKKLSDYFSEEKLCLVHKQLYHSPSEIRESATNPSKIKSGEPVEISYDVFDKNYLLKDNPLVATNLPQLVKFRGKGNLDSPFAMAKDGRVTARWTPTSVSDSLSAVLTDSENRIINEVVFKPVAGSSGFLRDLYLSTGGDHWTHHENWGTDAPLADWYGFRTTSLTLPESGEYFFTGYEVNLQDNNLVGDAYISNADSLIGIFFNGNRLNSITVKSSYISYLKVPDNVKNVLVKDCRILPFPDKRFSSFYDHFWISMGNNVGTITVDKMKSEYFAIGCKSVNTINLKDIDAEYLRFDGNHVQNLNVYDGKLGAIEAKNIDNVLFEKTNTTTDNYSRYYSIYGGSIKNCMINQNGFELRDISLGDQVDVLTVRNATCNNADFHIYCGGNVNEIRIDNLQIAPRSPNGISLHLIVWTQKPTNVYVSNSSLVLGEDLLTSNGKGSAKNIYRLSNCRIYVWWKHRYINLANFVGTQEDLENYLENL